MTHRAAHPNSIMLSLSPLKYIDRPAYYCYESLPNFAQKSIEREVAMTTFCMFGRYSSGSLKKISPKRTSQVSALIKNLNGQIVSMYALLGKYDLVFIVNFPGIDEAMKASIAISKMTGISFMTQAAVPVEKFDSMTAKL